ncbi:MAG: hypothetical protein K0B11_07905 [Mariniphaga sp.]|nr:hypothetical protein [Mariniphaga sp.]
MKHNIYIRSLEIGINSFPNGISYNNLKKQLINEKYQIEDDFEEYFLNWFFENFYERTQFPYYHGIRYGNNFRKKKDIDEIYKNRKCILSAKSYFNFLEYVELIETKKSSKQANRNALIAIILTLLALIISIWSNFFY